MKIELKLFFVEEGGAKSGARLNTKSSPDSNSGAVDRRTDCSKR